MSSILTGEVEIQRGEAGDKVKQKMEETERIWLSCHLGPVCGCSRRWLVPSCLE
jgi:hypothetical protein